MMMMRRLGRRRLKEGHEEAKDRWLDNGVLEDTCPSLDGNL